MGPIARWRALFGTMNKVSAVRAVTSSALVSLVLLASACLSPAELTLARSAPVTSSAKLSTSSTKPVVCVHTIDDQRPLNDELGKVGGRSFSAKDVPAWIEQRFRNLASPAFTLADTNTATKPALTIRPRILKAYVGSVDITKTAVIVVEVDYIGADDTITSLVYRGQHAAMNWASDEEEVRSALEKALNRCLTRVKADIEQRIKTAPAT